MRAVERSNTPRGGAVPIAGPAPIRAWLVAGILLILGVVVGSVLPAAGLRVGVGPASALLFAAALVVLALGIRGQGRLTPGPAATGALLAWAAWSVMAAVALEVGLSPDPIVDPGLALTVSTLVDLVSFALAVAGVAGIARSPAVPRPWNLAPLGGLALLALGWLSVRLPAGIAADPTALAPAAAALSGILSLTVPLALGMLAIVLAFLVPWSSALRGAAEPTG